MNAEWPWRAVGSTPEPPHDNQYISERLGEEWCLNYFIETESLLGRALRMLTLIMAVLYKNTICKMLYHIMEK